MRKMYASAAVVALVAVALLAGAFLPATSQVPGERTELQFFDPNKRGTFERFVDVGKRGEGPGDFGVFKDLQLDPETCEKAGTAIGRFQLIKAIGNRDGYATADIGLLLPDGKITFYFPVQFSEFEAEGGATGAVTGGTGAYKDARGEVTVTERQDMCDERGALITLDLLLQ
jgi:hypothetical protein